MTTSTPVPISHPPHKSSWLSGCIITVLIALFSILGIYNFVYGSIIIYVFTSAGMFSLVNLVIAFIIFCVCVIYFLLVFRIKRQHWFISLAMVALVWVILPLSLYLLLNISTTRIRNDGFSMENTLPNGSYILTDRLAYQHNVPRRGDIVIFTYPMFPEQEIMKRVIGLPGENIVVKDGKVTINNVLLDEPYTTEPPQYSGKWVVPQGQYFVLGDNRNNSSDSHTWGFLPQENIIAKATWIYYPLANFGKIDDVNYSP
jgi:signal peptidase I